MDSIQTQIKQVGYTAILQLLPVAMVIGGLLAEGGTGAATLAPTTEGTVSPLS